MSETFINVHFRFAAAQTVLDAIKTAFGHEDFESDGEQIADAAVRSEEAVDDGVYGVMVSGVTGVGWVSAYVDDWVDSGVVAISVSSHLKCWALEIWREEVTWGCTLYNEGMVLDRFTNDPEMLADDPDFGTLHAGDYAKFQQILTVPPEKLKLLLELSREKSAEEYSVPAISQLADCIGLPFEHALIGLDGFFDDDPDDYVQDLAQWESFRFLTFRHHGGRHSLAR